MPISRDDELRKCAFRDQTASHDPSKDESNTALYGHRLSLESARGQPVPKDTELSSRSPSPLVKRSRSCSLTQSRPSTTLIAFTATPVVVQVEKEILGRSKRKRNAVGRKSEQRRTQNMFAQKKYRDKRLHAAELVSH